MNIPSFRRFRVRFRGDAGFTLLELLVSISILSILFLLLFVPLLASMNVVHQAQGNIAIQDALRTVSARVERELRNAIFVVANDLGGTTLTAGIAPPLAGSQPWMLPVANGSIFKPGDRVRLGTAGQADFNAPWTVAWATQNLLALRDANTSRQLLAHNSGDTVAGMGRYFDGAGNPETVLNRLDFLLPRNTLSGGSPRILFPLQAEQQIVTYYVRLRQPFIDANGNRLFDSGDTPIGYDEIENPLVLYRAQYDPSAAPATQLRPTTSVPRWLASDGFDLEGIALAQPLAPLNVASPPLGQHTALTPSEDLNLLGNWKANITNPACAGTVDSQCPSPTGSGCCRLWSDTTFITEDTDGDGKVDRVTINLVVGRHDAARRETVRETLRKVVEIKNAK